MTTPSDFTSRVCFIALQARKLGYSDVAAWMQKHLTQEIRKQRGTRRRGVKVRLGDERGPRAILDEARVKELME